MPYSLLLNFGYIISFFPFPPPPGAINALLRLQDVYALSSEQLVEGTVKGFSKSSKLTG